MSAGIYKTPGVYVEEIPKFPPSIAPVATAIPAFIGYTEKAKDKIDNDLRLKPKRIASLTEYERFFGFPQPENNIDVTIGGKVESGKLIIEDARATLTEADRSKHIMYYSLQMFFANGGESCYIVSVGSYKNLGVDLIQIELARGLTALEQADEPTLIVFPEAQYLSISDCKGLYDSALLQCSELQDRFVIMDVHGVNNIPLNDPTTVSSNFRNIIETFRDNGVSTNHLKYGAAYAPNIETILDYYLGENDDAAPAEIDVTFPGGSGKLKDLKENNNAVYERAKAAIRDLPCKLPPCGAMAGIYAQVDGSRGVWKAPANVSITNVIQPTIPMTANEQADINVDVNAGKSVNAIRAFTGKGTLVWGARTLAGNDNEWRYVSVRRFFNFVEESVKKATEQFVFEPNDANTWVKVQAMIENFLNTQWRQGALQGIKPEHAFYVAVGLGKTMTPLDILEGRMIIEIGMAVVRPAEFIILRFSHKMAES
jgi:uncharacterized protein